VLCNFIDFATHEENIQPADVIKVGEIGSAASSGTGSARNAEFVRRHIFPDIFSEPPVIAVEVDLPVFVYSVSPFRHNPF